MRAVYTAAAPDFRPVCLTRFLEDNGIDANRTNHSFIGMYDVATRS